MTDMNKINDEALKNVTGGARRTVDTCTSQNAAVRSDAGLGFEQIASLKIGTIVNATGTHSISSCIRVACSQNGYGKCDGNY